MSCCGLESEALTINVVFRSHRYEHPRSHERKSRRKRDLERCTSKMFGHLTSKHEYSFAGTLRLGSCAATKGTSYLIKVNHDSTPSLVSHLNMERNKLREG